MINCRVDYFDAFSQFECVITQASVPLKCSRIVDSESGVESCAFKSIDKHNSGLKILLKINREQWR